MWTLMKIASVIRLSSLNIVFIIILLLYVQVPMCKFLVLKNVHEIKTYHSAPVSTFEIINLCVDASTIGCLVGVALIAEYKPVVHFVRLAHSVE